LVLALTLTQGFAAPGGPKKVDAGILRNGSATITVPTSTDTLVGRATTDTLSSKTLSDALSLTEITTPSTPAAGKRKIYAKSGGIYDLDSSGTETLLVSAGGAGPRSSVILYDRAG
jgi:hypothetical protein